MSATPSRSYATLALLVCLFVGVRPQAEVGTNGEVDGLTAKFVDVNGVRTRYYDYGRGEAILLVHGAGPGAAGSSANGWSRNIRGLATSFRVLAVDRLAQGMTDGPADDRAFGFEGQVEHLFQFVRAMKLDAVHLVGSSSGGAAILALALAHPQIVKTFTWVSGGAALRKNPSKLQREVAKCPADPLSAEYQKCRMAARGPAPGTYSAEDEKVNDWMWNLPQSVAIRKRLAALRAAGTLSEAEGRTNLPAMWEKVRSGSLQVPILLYNGKQDVFDWDADAPSADLEGALAFLDTFGAKNSRVKLIVVNGAGHFVHRERAEQFNADLTQFIEFSATPRGRATR